MHVVLRVFSRSVSGFVEVIASRETAPGPERCISRLVLPGSGTDETAKKKHHDGIIDIVVQDISVTFCKLRHAHRIVRSPLDQLLSAGLCRLRGSMSE